MTEVKHTTRMLRVAPRKLRLVADKMRRMNALSAMSTMSIVNKKSGLLVAKALHSAITVAEDRGLDKNSLVITQVWCDEGPKLKRMVKHSRGRSAMIMKKYSHLNMVLEGTTKPKTRLKAAKLAGE